MARAHLYGAAYSPWTERARWALDHHRIAHQYHEHVPMLGEFLLRAKAKVPRGQRTTVPLFIDEHGARYMDSIAIILRSDEGQSRPLTKDSSALRELAAIVETALDASRARVTSRILADPEAQRESAKAAVPGFLVGFAAPVAALGAKFIAKKHGVRLGHEQENIDVLRGVLRELRSRVRLDQPPTRDTLTSSDILIATLLQTVQPVDASHITLGPALRRAWGEPSLAREFADLVAWRDAAYRAAR